MEQWYVMDMFRQVFGPYDLDEVRRRVQKGSAIFVAKQGMRGWLTPETTPELNPGQGTLPPEPATDTRTALVERSVSELLTLCRTLIEDGTVSPKEAIELRNWIVKNSGLAGVWPANVIVSRMNRVFADGKVDAAEQLELAVLLGQITAEKPPVADVEQRAFHLEFDEPEPELHFHGARFCLAGRFAHGTPHFCAGEIERRGGRCQDAPDADTDYLVVGALAPSDGAKDPRQEAIARVLASRRMEGSKTAIITEEHWAQSLG